MEQQLAQFARGTEIQTLLAATARSRVSTEARLSALRAMAYAPLRELPPAWAASLADVMAGRNPELNHSAITAARALPPAKNLGPELGNALLRVAANHAQ